MNYQLWTIHLIIFVFINTIGEIPKVYSMPPARRRTEIKMTTVEEVTSTTTGITRSFMRSTANILQDHQDSIKTQISKLFTTTNSVSNIIRALEVSEQCLQELRQIEAANITLSVDTENFLNISPQSDIDIEQYCDIKIQKGTITCNYGELLNGNNIQSFSKSCKSAGGVVDNFRIKIFIDDIEHDPLTIIFNGIPSCVGPSCARDEYVEYVQLFLDNITSPDDTGNDTSAASLYSPLDIEFSSAGYIKGKGPVSMMGSSSSIAIVLVLVVVVSAWATF